MTGVLAQALAYVGALTLLLGVLLPVWWLYRARAAVTRENLDGGDSVPDVVDGQDGRDSTVDVPLEGVGTIEIDLDDDSDDLGGGPFGD